MRKSVSRKLKIIPKVHALIVPDIVIKDTIEVDIVIVDTEETNALIGDITETGALLCRNCVTSLQTKHLDWILDTYLILSLHCILVAEQLY